MNMGDFRTKKSFAHNSKDFLLDSFISFFVCVCVTVVILTCPSVEVSLLLVGRGKKKQLETKRNKQLYVASK